ncbi:hypothetical protein HDZ31DRAFT_43460 [Schizophyllum fasciatum]
MLARRAHALPPPRRTETLRAPPPDAPDALADRSRASTSTASTATSTGATHSHDGHGPLSLPPLAFDASPADAAEYAPPPSIVYDPARDTAPGLTRTVALPADDGAARPTRQLTREREALCPWEAFEAEAEGLGGRGMVVEDDHLAGGGLGHAPAPARRRDTADAPARRGDARPKSVLGTMGLRRVSAGGIGKSNSSGFGKSSSSGFGKSSSSASGKSASGGFGKSTASAPSTPSTPSKAGTLKGKQRADADGAPSTYLSLLADKGRGQEPEPRAPPEPRAATHAGPAAHAHPSTSTLASVATASSSVATASSSAATAASSSAATASSLAHPSAPTSTRAGGCGGPASAVKREEVVPWEFEGAPGNSDDEVSSSAYDQQTTPPRASTSSKSGHAHRQAHAYTPSRISEAYTPSRGSEAHTPSRGSEARHARDSEARHGPADLSDILRHPLDALKHAQAGKRDQETRPRAAAHSRELAPTAAPTHPVVHRPEPAYAYAPEAGPAVTTLSARPPAVRLGPAADAPGAIAHPTPVYPSFAPAKRGGSPGAVIGAVKRVGSPVAKIVSRVANESPPLRVGGSPPLRVGGSPPLRLGGSPPLRIGGSPPAMGRGSPPLRVGSSPPTSIKRSVSPVPRRGSPLARVDVAWDEGVGANATLTRTAASAPVAAPEPQSPVAAPIPRSVSAAPTLRSASAAPVMRTVAGMLRGSGKKGAPVPPISTHAPPSAYASSLSAQAPSLGPSTSESSTLASSLAQLSATSLSQLSETLALSDAGTSSAGHGSASTGHHSAPHHPAPHAQLQAPHLTNAGPVRSPGVHPDVQYAKALVQRRKSTGTEHRRGASGGEVLRGPNGEVLRVPGEGGSGWGWGRRRDAGRKARAADKEERDEVRREESLRSGSSHGRDAAGARRDEGAHARMWEGVAGALVGGGDSGVAGRKPGEGMWRAGDSVYGPEPGHAPVFIADGRVLMPDGSALPVDAHGRILPPQNHTPVLDGVARVVLPDGRVLVADGRGGPGHAPIILPDGRAYSADGHGRVLPADERGVLVADGAHGRMIVDIGGIPRGAAGSSGTHRGTRSSEGLDVLSDAGSDGERFNTADRTILQELRRNQSAREAEFVVKGLPQRPQKHHPYRRDQVPYPRSYEREVLDLDVWETLFCQQLRGDVTWHIFGDKEWMVEDDESANAGDGVLKGDEGLPVHEKPSPLAQSKAAASHAAKLARPSAATIDQEYEIVLPFKIDLRRAPEPTKVLDVGCGTGTWVLNCAGRWKDAHFVGLDIVPLHPSAPAEVAGRVTWVQANFLEGLPFPNDEFDFVHIKRIALGVPEDRWDALFEEITRVMKPGAAFEMVEEDLFFPGMQPEEESSVESEQDDVLEEEDAQSANDGEDEGRSSIESITFADTPEGELENVGDNRRAHGIGEGTPGAPEGAPDKKEKTPDVDASQDVLHLLDTALSPVLEPGKRDQAQPPVPEVAGRSRSPTAESRPRPSLAESVSSQMTAVPAPSSSPPRHYQQPASVGGRALTHRARTLTTGSIAGSAGSGSRFVESSMASVAEVIDDLGAQVPGGLTAERPDLGAVVDVRYDARARPGRSLDVSRGGRARSVDLHQRASMDTTAFSEDIPPNPRDHSVLEHIYNEMHAARFVNLAPLSLLANTLRLHFEDVRSHPPLEFAFPPRPASPVGSDGSSDDSLSEFDNPGPSLRGSKAGGHPNSDPQRGDGSGLTAKNIVRHDTQLVTFDDSRLISFGGGQNIFRTQESQSIPAQRQRLESRANRNLHLDVRTLNLHLALRAAEIRACAEPMWEWVLEYQAKRRALQRSRSRASLAALSDMGRHGPEDEVAMLAREDFDELLARFDMDMRDRCRIGNALETRFGWPPATSEPVPERKAFDMACERYGKWRAQQDRREEAARRARASLASRRGSMSPVLQRSGSARSASRDVGRLSGASREPRLSGASSTPGSKRQRRQLSRAMCVFVGWKAGEAKR